MKFSTVLLPLFVIALAVTKFESVSAEDETTVEGSENNSEGFIEKLELLGIEKFKKLKEWVKEHYKKGVDHLKDKRQALKAIAKELLDHAKDVKGEVAREALEFLRPYKEDLGVLWKQIQDAMIEKI